MSGAGAPLRRVALCCAPLLLVAVACNSDDETESSAEADAPLVVGACNYTSPFTQLDECREYRGDTWTDSVVQADCEAVSGTLELGVACSTDGLLGACNIDAETEAGQVIFTYGSDAADCDGLPTGCEVFAKGAWEPAPLCDGSMSGGPAGVFIQPTLECRDALPGEPTGQSEGGQVCTWQSISGATEEGRRFVDYASCEVVLTQRPYYPASPAPNAEQPDPRMDDPNYVAELDWVRSQIEATACVCCHSNDAPGGASNWSIDAPGNWINTFEDTGLALGANFIASDSFGAYPPEDNNGFERETAGFPSTDPQRMKAFFEAELAHRGRTASDFASSPAFGGPLADQITYQPEACPEGVGVASNGTITWEGGDARYLYVLDAGSNNPTVPPNLDLPEGTRWRVDVPAAGTPLESGEVTYGSLPPGTSQRFPAGPAPTALVPGTTYYLYASIDVGIPATRCLFTF